MNNNSEIYANNKSSLQDDLKERVGVWQKLKPKGDPFMWGIIFTLSIWGLLAIYSSTGALAYKKNSGNVLRNKLVIKDAENQYTTAFTQLLSPYYLHL